MQPILLNEAIFSGMTSNAFKLGTALTCGWFWVRTCGCSMLYRGSSMKQIDFNNILVVADIDAKQIQPPSYVSHSNSVTYFYVIRRVSSCGQMECTLSAAVKISIDANGNLTEPRPNSVFDLKVGQTSSNKVHLIWFYSPIEQKAKPACFKVYYDGGAGQINYESPLATVSYTGRKFYSYQSSTLGDGTYHFAVRVEDSAGTTDGSLAQVMFEFRPPNPSAINILSVEVL